MSSCLKGGDVTAFTCSPLHPFTFCQYICGYFTIKPLMEALIIAAVLQRDLVQLGVCLQLQARPILSHFASREHGHLVSPSPGEVSFILVHYTPPGSVNGWLTFPLSLPELCQFFSTHLCLLSCQVSFSPSASNRLNKNLWRITEVPLRLITAQH